jgi:hypothetical protein
MPQIGEYCLRELRQIARVNEQAGAPGKRKLLSIGIGTVISAVRRAKARTIEAVLNKHPRWPSLISVPTPHAVFGGTKMMKFLMSAAIASGLAGLTSVAEARSLYDGSWNLIFATQRGTCDPTYDFSVNINDGIITHPNLVRFKGYVARSGAVRASVTVQDKYASGSGKLSNNTGRGTWSGYSGTAARCSGYWTAQRN